MFPQTETNPFINQRFIHRTVVHQIPFPMVKPFGITPFGAHYALRLNVKVHPEMYNEVTALRRTYPTISSWALTASNNYLQRFEGVLTGAELDAFKQDLKAIKLQSRIHFIQDELNGVPATRSERAEQRILNEYDDDLPF